MGYKKLTGSNRRTQDTSKQPHPIFYKNTTSLQLQGHFTKHNSAAYNKKPESLFRSFVFFFRFANVNMYKGCTGYISSVNYKTKE